MSLCGNYIFNDTGGLTYATAQRIDCLDARCDYLAPVRQAFDNLDELVREVRRNWPERYPVTPEIDALLRHHEHVIALLRDGRLKKLAEVCNASD